jgi:hypothetical protein
MYHFATLFDYNYLSRALALYRSLTQTSSSDFTFYILALDQEVISFFSAQNYRNIVVISLHDVEIYFPDLLAAKLNRSKVEYYFTLSPVLPLFIFQNYPGVQQVTTMDADLYFFADPKLILNAYCDASILVTPHDFSPEFANSKMGKFNVSFQSFKNDETGLKCLCQWKQKCLEWCHDYYDEENDRFADQKYLDKWPNDFENIAEINLCGAGRALWNLKRYHYNSSGKKNYVNGQPLIYFHFHHLRIFNRFFAISGFELYGVHSVSKEIKNIYHHYLKELNTISKKHTLHTNIIRFNSQQNKCLITKLFLLKGYWFFSANFIFYIRPYRGRLIKQFINYGEAY